MPMQITKFAHSCVLVDSDGVRVLFDPGNFTTGFEDLTGLTAILVTHQHPDHLDLDRLPALLARNPEARVSTDPGSAQKLDEAGIAARAVQAGNSLDVGTSVTVHAR